MTHDDAGLHERLARLADAVPVAGSGSLARVSAGSVERGSAARRLRPGALLMVVALVVAGAVIAAIASVDRLRPGATEVPVAHPISATVTDGAFELTIRASKNRYAVAEPIAIDGVLTYHGTEAVTIFHAQGAPVPGRGNLVGPDTGGSGGPIGFGIVEPVLGNLRLGANWMESCERTTLEPGQPLVVPFAKGAAWSSDDPRADEFRAFVRDPELRLAAGTWHAFAVARFSLDDCGGDPHEPRAELQFEVSADAVIPTVDPAAPTPAFAPVPSASFPADTATEGPYTLDLRSERAVYHESDAIDITGAFSYSGDRPVNVQGFKPLVFGVAEPVHGIDLGMVTTLECNHETLEPGERFESPFRKGGGVSTSDAQYERKKAYLTDPVFRLPPGTWHIRLAAWLYEGDCGTAKTTLSTEIEIVVVAD